jgi:hypothetical protein
MPVVAASGVGFRACVRNAIPLRAFVMGAGGA